MGKPTVLIMRGIAGVGKTFYYENTITVAQRRVFSADKFRINPTTGAYEFNKANPGEAHNKCFWDYLNYLHCWDYYQLGESPNWLIIDNTNCQVSEIAPYVLAASAYGLDHIIRTIWCDPNVAAGRNRHDVPPATIYAMYRNLVNAEFPPYWKHEVVYPSTGIA